MLEIQCRVPEIYRRVRLQALLLARVELVESGFRKVRLPSPSDEIADITAGPSRAKSGHSSTSAE